MESWISWAIVIASIIHIFDEYFGGWLIWVQKYAKGVTKNQFVFVNSLFVILCVCASIGNSLIFKLSIASLIFMNALIHIIPTVVFKHYSPGIISAVILYIPISIYAYYSAIISNEVDAKRTVLSIIIGIILMSVPIIAQIIRIKYLQKDKSIE